MFKCCIAWFTLENIVIFRNKQ